METVTLQTLKDIEMLSDTEGAYLFDLAEKLQIIRAEPAQAKPIRISLAEAS